MGPFDAARSATPAVRIADGGCAPGPRRPVGAIGGRHADKWISAAAPATQQRRRARVANTRPNCP
ncbi:MAG: hypothetical protein U0232_03865 [Thermomicrobiales bacterium]